MKFSAKGTVGREVTEGWRTLLHGTRTMRQFERIYPARVTEERRPVLDIDSMHASDDIRAWHWWSLAELETTEDVVYPVGLADVLRDLTSSSRRCNTGTSR
jgi:hypothetical protein